MNSPLNSREWSGAALETHKGRPTHTEQVRVLVIDVDEVARRDLIERVAGANPTFVLNGVGTAEEANPPLATGNVDVILLDASVPSTAHALIFAAAKQTPVVYVAAANDFASALTAMRAGAAEYVFEDVESKHLELLPFTLTRLAKARHATRLFAQSQQLCHELFDQEPFGKILMDLDCRVLRTNGAVCLALGYTDSEIVTGGLEQFLSPSDAQRWKKETRLLVNGSVARYRVDLACRQKSGLSRNFALHASLIRNTENVPALIAMHFQDTTVFGALDRSLGEIETNVCQLLDSIPIAIFASDATGMVTYYNPATAALWGRTPKLMDPSDRFCATCRIFDLDGTQIPAERNWIARALAERRVLQNEKLVIEFATGRRSTVLAQCSPIRDASGHVCGAINLLVDITELSRHDRQRPILEAQLQHVRKLKGVGTLAGGVAHEFNNLLTAIIGNMQLAELETAPDHGATPYIEEAVVSSRRARDLVKRLLTLSHHAEGTKELVDLGRIISETTEVARSSLSPGIELLVPATDRCPPVLCNVCELREAITQLMANANQAMKSRGGVLLIALQHRVPEPELRERYPDLGLQHVISVTVHDTGIGMNAETLSKIFSPFDTVKPPVQGSGLGLAGVYGFMKNNDGVATVESKVGIGTTVRLFFPAAHPATPGPKAAR